MKWVRTFARPPARHSDDAIVLGVVAIISSVLIVATALGVPSSNGLSVPLRLTSPAEIALTVTVAVAMAVCVAIARTTIWPLLVVAAIAWLAFATWPAVGAASIVATTRLGGWKPITTYVLCAGFLLAVPLLAIRATHPDAAWGELGIAIVTVLPMTIVVPVLAGLWINARRATTNALRERVVHAQREQEARAEQARAEERARIAREMHDVVAHRISLIVLQTTAAQVSTGTASGEQLAQIRDAARDALSELREVLGVLHRSHDAAERMPQPQLADLERLIDQSRAAGASIEHEIADGLDNLDELPPVTQRAAYRIVQEGLTNAHKHAHGAPITVSLTRGETELRVTVHNHAPSRPPPENLTGSGSGLIGLGQRVELLGGDVRAAPNPSGGFTLEATLPIRGDATQSVDHPHPTPRPDAPEEDER